MKTTTCLFICLCVLAVWHGTGAAELKKAVVPDVELTPSLTSVLSQKNSAMPTKSNAPARVEKNNARVGASPATNGYVLPGGNVIVDNPVEPKCVFYGNYNEGSGDAFQYLDVNTIVFECQ